MLFFFFGIAWSSSAVPVSVAARAGQYSGGFGSGEMDTSHVTNVAAAAARPLTGAAIGAAAESAGITAESRRNRQNRQNQQEQQQKQLKLADSREKRVWRVRCRFSIT